MKRAITGRPETNNDLAQGEVLNFDGANKENTMDRNKPRLNWNRRGLLTGLMIGLLLMVSAPTAALAGAMVNKVWFPDGVIRWAWSEAPVPPDTNQNLAFGYLADHTPLRISETTPPKNKAERKKTLQLRWSGGDWNVTRGYWQPNDGGDFDWQYSLAFAKPADWGDTGAIEYGFWVDGELVPPPIPSEPKVTTIVHEFGHALGFAHEFQRDERDDFVTLSGLRDIWNYGKLKSWLNLKGYRNLSPFDHASAMNRCYIEDANDPTCGVGSSRKVSFIDIPATPVREYELLRTNFAGTKITNHLSVHDINSIYRVYARPLGNNHSGDDFGHSVATGDFDDDGHEDIAVAAAEEGASADRQLLKVHLYRGVSLAVEPGDGAIDLHHVPWLSYTLDLTDDADRRVVLAAGDFNGDQIDDLAVGDPGFDDGSGRVFVVFFNQAWIGEAGACGGDACAPWGERSVLGHHVILPEDVGLAAGEAHGFGAALAVADVTRKRKGSGELEQHQAEDLLIGAPGAFEYDPYEAGWAVDSLDTGTTSYGPELGSGDESFSQPQPQPRARVEEGGAVIMVRPNIMANLHDPAGASSLNWEVFDSRIVWNPGSFDAEFGAAIGRIPSFCDKAENESGVPLDGFAVGAPGEGSDAGAVYYYDCAVGQKGKWMTPLTTTGSHLHPTPMHRYGTSVMGFSITEMELPGCMTDHYIVAGAPRHPAAIGPMLSGRVYLHSVDDQGNTDLVTTLRPVSTVSGDDLFGAALAVHQEPSDQCFDEADEVVGGGHVEIAVGMPGNTVSGNDNAGRVYIWNPWNTDGSINHNSVIESPAPVLPETRFGQSIATVRNLTEGGGFVIGAPGGFGGFDLSKLPEEFKSITSGFIRTVLNQDFSTDFAWSSYPRVLTQATGAESPPTNLNTACGLGFEAAVIVPLLMLGRSLRARRSSRRGAGSGR